MLLLQNLTNTASHNSKNHGALKDGDYVAIKFHPSSEFAFPVFIGSDYQKAHQKVNSLLNSHYSRFNNAPSLAYYVIKKFHKGVLHPIIEDGEINRKLAQSIDSKCEIVTYKPSDGRTDCAYIYRMIITSGIDEMDSRYHGFDRFPNPFLKVLGHKIASSFLLDWDEDDDEDLLEDNLIQPQVCRTCSNYHGQSYNGNPLVCGMHPYGYEGSNCPDYSTEKQSRYPAFLEEEISDFDIAF